MLVALLLLLGLFLLKLFYLIHPKVLHGFWEMRKPSWTSTSVPDSVWPRATPVSIDWESAAQVTAGLCIRTHHGINRLGLPVGLDLLCWHRAIMSYLLVESIHAVCCVHVSVNMKFKAGALLKAARLQACSHHGGVNRNTARSFCYWILTELFNLSCPLPFSVAPLLNKSSGGGRGRDNSRRRTMLA